MNNLSFKNRKNKLSLTRKFFPIWISICSTVSFFSCTSVPKENLTSNTVANELFEIEPDSLKFCKQWQFDANANLSYLSTNANSELLLLSTSNDKANPKGFEARLRLISEKTGKVLWSQWIKQPIKRPGHFK